MSVGVLNLKAALSIKVHSSCVRGCWRFVGNGESTGSTLFSALCFLAHQETPDYAFLLLGVLGSEMRGKDGFPGRNGTF